MKCYCKSFPQLCLWVAYLSYLHKQYLQDKKEQVSPFVLEDFKAQEDKKNNSDLRKSRTKCTFFSQRTWLNLLKYEELDLGSPYRNVILLEMIYTT